MLKLRPSWLSGVLLVLVLASCGGKKNVMIQTMRPAEVAVKPEIKTILVLDRTRPDKRSSWMNIGEGILTGELPEEDKAAAQVTINAIKTQLQYSPRFQVKVARERFTGNSLTSAFPPALDWNLQKNLLQNYQADALVSLEILDSDFIVTQGKRKVKRTVGSGENRREVEVDEWYAQGVGNLKLGIRYYDPYNKEIIDEQLLSQTNTWEGAAESKAAALAALISKSNATKELCRRVGKDYAYKIAPMPVQLSRVFYTKSKKSPQLEHGGRLAEVGNWQEAIEVWEQAIPGSESKEAGRMAMNIAVAYEVLGDLNTANSWAQKAYAQYGNKAARTYASQIQRRMLQEQIVNDQMAQ